MRAKRQRSAGACRRSEGHSRVLHHSFEVDDYIVQLGVQDLVDRVKRSGEVDDRIPGAGLKGPQQGWTIVTCSSKGLRSKTNRRVQLEGDSSWIRFATTHLDRADSIGKVDLRLDLFRGGLVVSRGRGVSQGSRSEEQRGEGSEVEHVDRESIW